MQTEKLKVAYQNKYKITELWVGGKKKKKREKKEDICKLFSQIAELCVYLKLALKTGGSSRILPS